jgi:hypothetical protein
MNIHKAGKLSDFVDKSSAGCQVFKNTTDFNEFMDLVKKQDRKYPNSLFDYTLLDTRNYTIIADEKI